ncbi:hypothetical protein [Aerococcus sp. UMB7834]|uniref:hypothetical protein n=1 Tax=Aerococcus sp. UMB7834 TaxID=3046342 RepID=UPI00254E94CD|nr:hypothetical protein [Aerococcus sp. UMB7834]MDK6804242.1 hypothetical protein [Aerococcus sp. UMB7834]
MNVETKDRISFLEEKAEEQKVLTDILWEQLEALKLKGKKLPQLTPTELAIYGAECAGVSKRLFTLNRLLSESLEQSEATITKLKAQSEEE